MEYIIEEKDNKVRLDNFLYEKDSSFTRSHYKNLITEGHVLVNDKQVKAGYNLRVGDRVVVEMIPNQPIETKAENIPLDIVYQDEDLAVINKPKGMVVHPANGNWNGTLVNALLYNIKDHRLKKYQREKVESVRLFLVYYDYKKKFDLRY